MDDATRRMWQMASGVARVRGRTLDELFRLYADPQTSPLEQEGMIRGIMTVSEEPHLPVEGRDARRQIVRFLCDIGNEHDPVTEGNPPLRRIARLTLAKHVLSHVGMDEDLTTMRRIVTFYDTPVHQTPGWYVDELPPRERKSVHDAFRVIGGNLHHRCVTYVDDGAEPIAPPIQYCGMLVATKSWAVLRDVCLVPSIPFLWDALRQHSLMDEFSRSLAWEGWTRWYHLSRAGVFHSLDKLHREWPHIEHDVLHLTALCGVGVEMNFYSSLATHVRETTVEEIECAELRQTLGHVLGMAVRYLRRQYAQLSVHGSAAAEGTFPVMTELKRGEWVGVRKETTALDPEDELAARLPRRRK